MPLFKDYIQIFNFKALQPEIFADTVFRVT